MTITTEPGTTDAGTAAHSPSPGPRSPGATYQQLLDADSRPENVPVVLRWQDNQPLGDTDIPRERYVSRDFYELEKEKMWKRTWQMACREEDIPEVGDTCVYDICELSILVVRVSEHEIKGFFNACLHRGRQLRDTDGPAHELRCPFHGYCWNLDGSLKQIPCEWDFPHVEPDEWALPEVQVGTWGGFVFINMDPGCEPLEHFLGELPSHFEKWPLEQRYKSAHVARIFPTNWKVVQEAFMEAFHVVATHPQLLAGIGDANTAYDWSGNFSRAVTPNGTPSPHIRFEPTQQEMFDAMTDRRLDEPFVAEVPEGGTARGTAGDGGRMMMAAALGDGADQLSDAALSDSHYYTLFPNLHPWGAYNQITYRFRPFEDRHDMSIMECMFLSPYDQTQPKPPAVPIHWLGVDDDWTQAPELGLLARVFNQDTFNLPKVQKGLGSLRKGITLANYQETKIRHFHHILDRYLNRA
jgi:phenylpropionate dioxygenase-like ring-hydroxylating dioxygenase large terminal subunit